MERPNSRRTPRREVWWLDLGGTKNQNLESIKRRFEDCLDRFPLSSSNSLLRHFTSPMDSRLRHNLHQCPGYLREEITLASDVSKSAIISHAFPSQSEVCSICGQLVQYKCTEPPNVDGEKREANFSNGSRSLPAMLGMESSLDFSITVSHLYMEPLAFPQSDVREIITPSLSDGFLPCSPVLTSPCLTPRDSTMDTPLFDLDDSHILTDPYLFPMLFPEWEDVQERVTKAESLLELDPSALIVMTPPKSPFLGSYHLSRLQPSGIPSPHSSVVGPPSPVSSDMTDSGSIWMIPPSPTLPIYPGRRFMTSLHSCENGPEETPIRRRRIPIACTSCRSRKLKVSKPFSEVSYTFSHYTSVVNPIRLI